MLDGDGIVQQGTGPNFKPVPGLLRLLPGTTFTQTNVTGAIAALISFQDRYDISCRLEWDHDVKQWKIMANTLGDLTKRENRFGHYGFWPGKMITGVPSDERRYPFALESIGNGYSGNTQNVAIATDPDVSQPNKAESDCEYSQWVSFHLHCGSHELRTRRYVNKVRNAAIRLFACGAGRWNSGDGPGDAERRRTARASINTGRCRCGGRGKART